MYSVRNRLLILLVAGFAILILGSGFFVARTIDARAVEAFDAGLLAKCRAIAALTESEADGIEFEYRAGVLPAFEREDDPEYFQLWHADGRVIRRSERLTADLPRDATSRNAFDVQLPDGRAGRALQYSFVPAPDEENDEEDDHAGAVRPPAPPANAPRLVLVVARGRDRLDTMLAGVRWAIFGAGTAAIALGALLVSFLLARGFAPLQALASQLATLDADTLQHRVDVSPTPRELTPVVNQVNGMLERIDESFARERRFAGNVAHELRTPLAELRTLAAVGGKWPEDRDAIQDYFADVDAVAGRMESVIEDLLLLARCHAGAESAQCVPTDVSDIVRDVSEALAPKARSRNVTLCADVLTGFLVDSDPGKLAIIVSNLLGNAVSYAKPGTEVTCTGTLSDNQFSLQVVNEADLLAPGDIARLTEPFWRSDQARTDDGHVGLGLSLVAALADVLAMDFAVTQAPDGSFAATLSGEARIRGPYRAATPWVRRRRHPQQSV